MKLTIHKEEITLLLELSTQRPCEIDFSLLLEKISNSFDWTYFLERAIANNLAGFLLEYPTLAKKYYPDFVFEKLLNYQQRIQMHSLQLIDLLNDIIRLFEANQIDYAVLKGCAGLVNKSFHFNKRQVSDIDILIDPSKQEEVNLLLKANHYHTTLPIYPTKWHQNHPTDHAPIHAYKFGKVVDVHISLFPLHTGYAIETYELLNNRQAVLFDQTTYMLLGTQEAGLFNILHCHKHLYFGNNFKAGSLPDFHLLDFSEFDVLAIKWKTTRQLEEMKKFWESWKRRDYNATFIGKTAMKFIENKSLSLDEKWIKLYRRIFNSQKNLWHPMQLIGKLLPSKAYLNAYFGQGPYFLVWMKRFFNLFKLG